MPHTTNSKCTAEDFTRQTFCRNRASSGAHVARRQGR